jgi:hypothetical protein
VHDFEARIWLGLNNTARSHSFTSHDSTSHHITSHHLKPGGRSCSLQVRQDRPWSAEDRVDGHKQVRMSLLFSLFLSWKGRPARFAHEWLLLMLLMLLLLSFLSSEVLLDEQPLSGK